MDITNYVAVYEGGYTIELNATTIEDAREEAPEFFEVEYEDLFHPPYDPLIEYKRLLDIEEQ